MKYDDDDTAHGSVVYSSSVSRSINISPVYSNEWSGRFDHGESTWHVISDGGIKRDKPVSVHLQI